jgi:hypothetical protein
MMAQLAFGFLLDEIAPRRAARQRGPTSSTFTSQPG